MSNTNVSLTVRLVDQLSGVASRIAGKVRDIGTGFAKLGGDAAQANKKFANFDKTLERMANASLAMQGLSRVAAGLRQKLGSVVTGTANFDDALQGIAQTAGLTADRKKELRGRILELAAAYGKLPADFLEGTYGQFVQGGLADKIAESLSDVSGRVSRATRADLKDIANTAIALNQNLGILKEQMKDVFGGLHQAGKEGRFELKDMSQYFARSAGFAQQFGMKGKRAAMEIAAAFEVARMSTGDPSQAATNVENLFQKMASPHTVDMFRRFGVDIRKAQEEGLKEGRSPLVTTIIETKKLLSGAGIDIDKVIKEGAARGKTEAEALEEWAKNLGTAERSIDEIFSSDKFLKALRSPETVRIFKNNGINLDKKIQWGIKHGKTEQEVIRHWAEKLINSKQGKAQGLTWEKLFPDLPKKIALSDLFQDQQAYMAIAAMIAHFDEFFRIREAAMKAGADVIERDFEKMNATSKASFDRLKASSESLGLTWGDVLAPAAAFAADMVAKLSNGMRALMDNHPMIGAIGGGIAGAVVALGSAVASASNVIVGLAASVALLKGTATGAAIARVLGGIGRGFASIARLPWAAIRGAVFGIRGLIAGVSVIAGALAGITAPVWAGVAAVAAAVIGLGVVIYKYWQPIKAFVSGVMAGIARHVGPALRGVIDFVDRLARAIESVLAPIRSVVRAVKALGRMIFGDDPAKAATRISTWTAGLVNWAKSLFAPVELSEQARASWEAYGNAVVDAVAAIPGRIAGAVAGLGQKMFGDDPAKAATRISTWVADIVQKISDAFDVLRSIDLADAAAKLMDSLLEGLKSAATRVEQWVTGWVDWLKNKFSFTARPQIAPQGVPPVLDAPLPAQPQSAPAAPQLGPRERRAMNLIAPQITVAAASRATGGEQHATNAVQNRAVTVNNGPVTFHVANNDPEGAARAIMRALERRRQAGLWDGALA